MRVVWFRWDNVWKKLNANFDIDPSANPKAAWAVRACEVEQLVLLYVRAWVACVGPTEGLYLHLLLRHLPVQIALYGEHIFEHRKERKLMNTSGDLRSYQAQGLEHLHHIRKVY